MKKWMKPAMEVVVLDERDVIATSGEVDERDADKAIIPDINRGDAIFD